MTALHAIPYLAPARDRALLDLREGFVVAARQMVVYEERNFGALEKPEVKSQMEDAILRQVPEALQWQVDLFVNHALTVIHGDGPHQALLDLLKATDQVETPLDLGRVRAILYHIVNA
jgi:hypothetical protein